jgi:Tfp pilus assembly protein FimT
VKNSLPYKLFIDRKGVILLDLLIVAIILAILGMVAIPLFSSFIADNKLEGSAGELVAGLQYAGNLAVQYQRPFGLSADVAGNWFKVFDTSPSPNPTPPARPDNIPPVDENGVVLNPFDKTWYVRDFDTMDIYKGVQITSIPSGGTVQFYPDGHSGVIDSVFSISYGGKQKTITVNGTTGLITVQ